MMILDTGALYALFSPKDKYHLWSVDTIGAAHRLMTCEAVLTETTYLLRTRVKNYRQAIPNLFRLVNMRIDMSFSFGDYEEEITQLYVNRPRVLDFADSCLIVMAKLYPTASVATIDKDLKNHRYADGSEINVIMPNG